ncbi:hypothetical protein GGU11DRAFT_575357 [Lentinula aff. detonsa]|nr:hypothetical protein GGU11DRAFT_575357 [Lentinula aff. detonsa]
MRTVLAIMLVLQLLSTFNYALAQKGSKTPKGQKGRPAAANTQFTASRVSTPIYPVSHWVEISKSCTAEKTKMIDDWIVDVYNMTYEADSMTRDHAVFNRYFFREDFPKFEAKIQSFNSRAGLADGGRYKLACGDHRPLASDICSGPSQWVAVKPAQNLLWLCPRMFADDGKATLSSKPFDDSQDGWCEPTPHHFGSYVHSARVLMLGMARLEVFSELGAMPYVGVYHENDVPLWKAARNLKSKYTTLRAEWEHSDPRRRGHPPLPPIQNAESYAASILEFYFTRKCGKNFDPEMLY